MGESFRGQVLFYNMYTRKGTLIDEKDAREVRFFLCDVQGVPPKRGMWVTYDVGLDTVGRTKATRITCVDPGDGLVKIRMREHRDVRDCKVLYAQPKNTRFW